MCGRFESLDAATMDDLLRESESKAIADDAEIGEVFPTNVGLVQLKTGVKIMNWGIPKWDGKGVVINARQEGLMSSSFFKDDFKLHRCVVLTQSFYEWDKQKNKYRIYKKNQDALKFAGLYKVIDNVSYFAIITQESNGEFRSIHTRTPLMLEDEEVEAYLTSEDLKQWMKPKEYSDLKWEIL